MSLRKLFILPLIAVSLTAVGFGARLNASFGFEDGLAGWQPDARDQGMSRAVSEAARTGAFGLRVTDRSDSAGSSLFSEWVELGDARFCELTFHARTVESGLGMGVYLLFADANGRLVEAQDRFHYPVPKTDGRWRQVRGVASVPERAAKVRIWLHSYNKATGVVDLDDIELKLSETPPAPQREDAGFSSETGMPTRALAWMEDTRLLPEFHKENPALAYAELKITDAQGSAFRKPVEDWQAARDRAEQDGQWTQWIANKRRIVDNWMRNNRDHVEWAGGWAHDFVDPADGSRLVWTEQVPDRKTGHFVNRRGERVAVTPKLFDAWAGIFRREHGNMMVEAARLYRLTADARYAEWVAGQLDFYAENYTKWPLRNPKGSWTRLGCQSLDEANRLQRFVEAARLLADWAEPQRQQVWFDRLFKPGAEILDMSFHVIHNIAVWHRSVQAQIALLTGDAQVWNTAVEGPFGMRAQLERGVTGDYFWYEQSMGYNDYVVSAVRPLLFMIALADRRSEFAYEASLVQNLMLAPMAIRFPDNTLPNPADSSAILTVPSRELALSYRVLPTAVGLRQAGERLSWDRLVDPPEQIAAAGIMMPEVVMPEVVSANMSDSRFALLRQDGWQVFFHYGQLNRSHAQAEALNWAASFGDVVISNDPGTVGYGSNLASGYYRRGLNHNLPIINGEGQMPWARGELLEFDAIKGIASAVQPDYREGVAVTRTLSIEPGKLVDVVSLLAPEGGKGISSYGLSLHLYGKMIEDGRFLPAAEAFTRNRPEPFLHWENVRAAEFEDEATVSVDFGSGRVLEVTFRLKGPFVLYAGLSPDTPPNKRCAFYAESLNVEERMTITSEFSPKGDPAIWLRPD